MARMRVTAQSVTVAASVPPPESPGRARGRWRGRLRRAAPHLAYALLALAVTGHLWINRELRLVTTNPTDQEQFLWFLADAAHALAHGENPLLTHRLNVPGQVNLMANT